MNARKKAAAIAMCAALAVMPAGAPATGESGEGFGQGILCAAAPASQNAGVFRTDLAAEVVRQVNAERAKYGLPALRVDGELNRAAAVRAKEIAEKFSHTRPDGSKWSSVSGAVRGENIARGQKTADKVMAAWLTSRGHRANILRSGFGSIGVCAYVHNGIIHWVQLFGR